MPQTSRKRHSQSEVLRKSYNFGYNKWMNWVRRLFLYVLSVVLLICLLGIAFTVSLQVSVTHPNKIERWLDQSNLYTNLVTTITDQAQTSIANNVSGGALISTKVIHQAAQSAFSQSLLQHSVQTFLNANYSWLEGKTTIPNFKIDLSGAKQTFATNVAQSAVLAHLTGLPSCTTEQTLQLQSANPLLLSCLPAGVSPQYAAAQVSQQVATNGGFLSNPVITATTLHTKGQGNGTPYYQKFSRLPKIYQLLQKLPWMLSIVTLLLAIGVIFCVRTKRSGLKRISITLVIGGLLLIIDKFGTDAVFNRYKNQAFSGLNNAQVQQSLTSFAHYVEAQLVKIDLWFGVTYLLLGLIFLGLLLFTRHHLPKEIPVQSQANSSSTPINQVRVKSGLDLDNEHQPNLKKAGSAQAPKLAQNLKKRPPTRPPRLIQ